MNARFNYAYRLSLVLVCWLVIACAAGPQRPSGKVDWGTFDYKSSEQRASYPADYDADYVPPTEFCINDGYHTHNTCE